MTTHGLDPVKPVGSKTNASQTQSQMQAYAMADLPVLQPPRPVKPVVAAPSVAKRASAPVAKAPRPSPAPAPPPAPAPVPAPAQAVDMSPQAMSSAQAEGLAPALADLANAPAAPDPTPEQLDAMEKTGLAKVTADHVGDLQVLMDIEGFARMQAERVEQALAFTDPMFLQDDPSQRTVRQARRQTEELENDYVTALAREKARVAALRTGVAQSALERQQDIQLGLMEAGAMGGMVSAEDFEIARVALVAGDSGLKDAINHQDALDAAVEAGEKTADRFDAERDLEIQNQNWLTRSGQEGGAAFHALPLPDSTLPEPGGDPVLAAGGMVYRDNDGRWWLVPDRPPGQMTSPDPVELPAETAAVWRARFAAADAQEAEAVSLAALAGMADREKMDPRNFATDQIGAGLLQSQSDVDAKLQQLEQGQIEGLSDTELVTQLGVSVQDLNLWQAQSDASQMAKDLAAQRLELNTLKREHPGDPRIEQLKEQVSAAEGKLKDKLTELEVAQSQAQDPKALEKARAATTQAQDDVDAAAQAVQGATALYRASPTEANANNLEHWQTELLAAQTDLVAAQGDEDSLAAGFFRAGAHYLGMQSGVTEENALLPPTLSPGDYEAVMLATASGAPDASEGLTAVPSRSGTIFHVDDSQAVQVVQADTRGEQTLSDGTKVTVENGVTTYHLADGVQITEKNGLFFETHEDMVGHEYGASTFRTAPRQLDSASSREWQAFTAGVDAHVRASAAAAVVEFNTPLVGELRLPPQPLRAQKFELDPADQPMVAAGVDFALADLSALGASDKLNAQAEAVRNGMWLEFADPATPTLGAPITPFMPLQDAQSRLDLSVAGQADTAALGGNGQALSELHEEENALRWVIQAKGSVDEHQQTVATATADLPIPGDTRSEDNQDITASAERSLAGERGVGSQVTGWQARDDYTKAMEAIANWQETVATGAFDRAGKAHAQWRADNPLAVGTAAEWSSPTGQALLLAQGLLSDTAAAGAQRERDALIVDALPYWQRDDPEKLAELNNQHPLVMMGPAASRGPNQGRPYDLGSTGAGDVVSQALGHEDDALADQIESLAGPGGTVTVVPVAYADASAPGGMGQTVLFRVDGPDGFQFVDTRRWVYADEADYRANNALPAEGSMLVMPMDGQFRAGPDGQVRLFSGDARTETGWQTVKREGHLSEVAGLTMLAAGVASLFVTGGTAAPVLALLMDGTMAYVAADSAEQLLNLTQHGGSLASGEAIRLELDLASTAFGASAITKSLAASARLGRVSEALAGEGLLARGVSADRLLGVSGEEALARGLLRPGVTPAQWDVARATSGLGRVEQALVSARRIGNASEVFDTPSMILGVYDTARGWNDMSAGEKVTALIATGGDVGMFAVPHIVNTLGHGHDSMANEVASSTTSAGPAVDGDGGSPTGASLPIDGGNESIVGLAPATPEQVAAWVRMGAQATGDRAVRAPATTASPSPAPRAPHGPASNPTVPVPSSGEPPSVADNLTDAEREVEALETLLDLPAIEDGARNGRGDGTPTVTGAGLPGPAPIGPGSLAVTSGARQGTAPSAEPQGSVAVLERPTVVEVSDPSGARPDSPVEVLVLDAPGQPTVSPLLATTPDQDPSNLETGDGDASGDAPGSADPADAVIAQGDGSAGGPLPPAGDVTALGDPGDGEEPDLRALRRAEVNAPIVIANAAFAHLSSLLGDLDGVDAAAARRALESLDAGDGQTATFEAVRAFLAERAEATGVSEGDRAGAIVALDILRLTLPHIAEARSALASINAEPADNAPQPGAALERASAADRAFSEGIAERLAALGIGVEPYSLLTLSHELRQALSDAAARANWRPVGVQAGDSLPIPSMSLESVHGVLDAVWDRRDEFLSGGGDLYTGVYGAVSVPNPLTWSTTEYLLGLQALAADRPAGAESLEQHRGIDTTLAIDFWLQNKMTEERARGLEETFFHYLRAGFASHQIKQRVYLNVAADHAMELMNFVVREIVDNPGQFPGVEEAKVSGPRSVSNRAENIVIYVRDEALDNVLQTILRYQRENPSHFMPEVPAFTARVSDGVAIGDEPRAAGRSFGTVRSNLLKTALESAHDRRSLGAQFNGLLQGAGIDSERPHKNRELPRYKAGDTLPPWEPEPGPNAGPNADGAGGSSGGPLPPDGAAAATGEPGDGDDPDQTAGTEGADPALAGTPQQPDIEGRPGTPIDADEFIALLGAAASDDASKQRKATILGTLGVPLAPALAHVAKIAPAVMQSIPGMRTVFAALPAAVKLIPGMEAALAAIPMPKNSGDASAIAAGVRGLVVGSRGYHQRNVMTAAGRLTNEPASQRFANLVELQSALGRHDHVSADHWSRRNANRLRDILTSPTLDRQALDALQRRTKDPTLWDILSRTSGDVELRNALQQFWFDRFHLVDRRFVGFSKQEVKAVNKAVKRYVALGAELDDAMAALASAIGGQPSEVAALGTAQVADFVHAVAQMRQRVMAQQDPALRAQGQEALNRIEAVVTQMDEVTRTLGITGRAHYTDTGAGLMADGILLATLGTSLYLSGGKWLEAWSQGRWLSEAGVVELGLALAGNAFFTNRTLITRISSILGVEDGTRFFRAAAVLQSRAYKWHGTYSAAVDSALFVDDPSVLRASIVMVDTLFALAARANDNVNRVPYRKAVEGPNGEVEGPWRKFVAGRHTDWLTAAVRENATPLANRYDGLRSLLHVPENSLAGRAMLVFGAATVAKALADWLGKVLESDAATPGNATSTSTTTTAAATTTTTGTTSTTSTTTVGSTTTSPTATGSTTAKATELPPEVGSSAPSGSAPQVVDPDPLVTQSFVAIDGSEQGLSNFGEIAESVAVSRFGPDASNLEFLETLSNLYELNPQFDASRADGRVTRSPGEATRDPDLIYDGEEIRIQ